MALFLLAACAGEPTPAGLVLVPARWGTSAVRWSDGSRTTLLERFPAPEVVEGADVSADGRWAYVWHRPDGHARRVSVYDVVARERISTFTPGFGGALRFDSAGDLVHTWGCGTSCSNLRVTDRAGQVRSEWFAARIEVSPDADRAVLGPDVLGPGDRVELVDLVRGVVLNRASPWRLWEGAVLGATWGASEVRVEVLDHSTGVETSGQLVLGDDGTSAWVGADPVEPERTTAVPGAIAAVLAAAPVGTTRLTVDGAESFARGRQVVVVDLRSPRPRLARGRVDSASGGVVTLTAGLALGFEPPGIQLVEVVEATELVVPDRWAVPAWDGRTGGVAAFAAGRITVEGEIDADGAGRSGPGGRAGGVVFVEAQEVVGRGAIHARGDPGATDRPGGDGGTLWLDAPAVDVALDVSSGVDAVSGRILRVPDRP